MWLDRVESSRGRWSLKDIFDLFGLQQNRSVLTRTVAVGLSHHQNQITVRNRLDHKHPETTQTTSYSQSVSQSVSQSINQSINHKEPAAAQFMASQVHSVVVFLLSHQSNKIKFDIWAWSQNCSWVCSPLLFLTFLFLLKTCCLHYPQCSWTADGHRQRRFMWLHSRRNVNTL